MMIIKQVQVLSNSPKLWYDSEILADSLLFGILQLQLQCMYTGSAKRNMILERVPTGVAT